MRLALFANETKGHAIDVLNDVARYLTEQGDEILLQQAGFPHAFEMASIEKPLSKCDYVVSIGGDGSILHLLHRIGIPSCPVIGVNLGSLGFLADIHNNDIFGGFEAIRMGAYHVTNRIVIEGGIPSKFRDFAVNEVAVHRGDQPHLIDIAIHVDGQFVNTFSADGVILSTPSGSTAYSLSAGGPIVTPSSSVLILTPICAHTISNRPIVFTPKESVSIELWHGAKSVDVAFDGQPPQRIVSGEFLQFHISPKMFRLVSLAAKDFFSTLRTKLGWTGSLRKK